MLVPRSSLRPADRLPWIPVGITSAPQKAHIRHLNKYAPRAAVIVEPRHPTVQSEEQSSSPRPAELPLYARIEELWSLDREKFG